MIVDLTEEEIIAIEKQLERSSNRQGFTPEDAHMLWQIERKFHEARGWNRLREEVKTFPPFCGTHLGLDPNPPWQ